MAGEVKKQTFTEGTSVTSPTDISIDASNTAVSNQTGPGQLTITDSDDIRDVLVTVGSTSFDFVDGDVTGGDTITENTHGMVEGDVLRLTNSGGALPTGLSSGTTYFVRNPNVNDFQLSLTPDGSIVNITSATGGGTHTATRGFAVYLPTAGDNSGRRIRVTKIDAGTAFAETVAESGETVFGSRSETVLTQNGHQDVASDGSSAWGGYGEARDGKTGVVDFEEFSASLDNDFSGGTVYGTKLGSLVTLTVNGAAWSNLASVLSSSNVVPSSFQPTKEVLNVAGVESSRVILCRITTSGQVILDIRTSSDLDVAASGTTDGTDVDTRDFSISYIIH